MSEDCHNSDNTWVRHDHGTADNCIPWWDYVNRSAYPMVAPLLVEYKRVSEIMKKRRESEVTPWKLLFELAKGK